MDGHAFLRIAALSLSASLVAAPASALAASAGVAERISTAVARVMEYPREAQEEEGVAVLGFSVGRSGAAEAIELEESSGHPLLDAAALRAVTRLHGLPPEAAGRRLITVLQYRVGGPGRDPESARRLRLVVDQVKQRRSSALLSSGVVE